MDRCQAHFSGWGQDGCAMLDRLKGSQRVVSRYVSYWTLQGNQGERCKFVVKFQNNDYTTVLRVPTV